MKNTFLKYNKIETFKFITNDYTSKDYSVILNMPELEDSTWISYIDLIDNQTIEQVAFTLYGSADFWDILILINGIDPLFDMSYDFDIIDIRAEVSVTKYLTEYSGVYASDTFTRLKDIMTNRLLVKNEENRTLKIIQPDKLYDFIKLVNDLDI